MQCQKCGFILQMYIVYAINYWYMYLYRFIRLVDNVKVYGYLSPTPPLQWFINMFLQRVLRLHALVKSNSHWILIKIPLIDY